jgi:hypothetical protein
MAEETFFGYQDIGEKGFIRWSLSYTMEPIIECFLAIPETQRYAPVADRLPPPCAVLGHIARNEEFLIQGIAQGIAPGRCPFPAPLFDTARFADAAELRTCIPDSEAVVTYWRDVREDTLRFLDGLAPEDLRRRPARSVLPEGDPNRDNPMRELFLMVIQHQNCHWGELRAIGKLLNTPME